MKRYGYIKKGKEFQKHFQHKHNRERVSCLSAISTYFLKKSIAKSHKLFKGTVNAESYLYFIKEFLTILFYKSIFLQYFFIKSIFNIIF